MTTNPLFNVDKTDDLSLLPRFFEFFIGNIVILYSCLIFLSFQTHSADLNLPAVGNTVPLIKKSLAISNVIPVNVGSAFKQSMRFNDVKNIEISKYSNLDQSLVRVFQSSDFIFHGKVIDVQYISAKTSNNTGYPLTYITFSIIDILQGQYVKKKIVLMMAGVGQTLRKTVVFRSDFPVFSKDDELIVFLAKGKMNGPKYVHHFFVVDGDIFDDQSCEIVRGNNDEILRGPVIPQSKIFERKLGVGNLRLIRDSVDNSVSYNEISRNKNENNSSAPDYRTLNIEMFSELLAKKMEQLNRTKKGPLANLALENQTLESANSRLPLLYSTQDGLVRSGE